MLIYKINNEEELKLASELPEVREAVASKSCCKKGALKFLDFIRIFGEIAPQYKDFYNENDKFCQNLFANHFKRAM